MVGLLTAAVLADRYETLRASRATSAEHVGERRLLMARGLAGWIRSVLAAVPAADDVMCCTTAGVATPPVTRGQLPDALHAQATQLLASMLLANHAEEVRT